MISTSSKRQGVGPWLCVASPSGDSLPAMSHRDYIAKNRGVKIANMKQTPSPSDESQLAYSGVQSDNETARKADLLRIVPRGQTFGPLRHRGRAMDIFTRCLTEHFAEVTALDLQRPAYEFPGVSDCRRGCNEASVRRCVLRLRVLQRGAGTHVSGTCPRLARRSSGWPGMRS